MRKVVILVSCSLLAILFCACGSSDKKAGSSSSPSSSSATSEVTYDEFQNIYHYHFATEVNGVVCDTGDHTYHDPDTFCFELEYDNDNNSCALSDRQQAFGQFCPGGFVERIS